MPSLFITEFSSLQANPSMAAMPLPVTPSLADQVVTIGAASAQSTGATAQTLMVRLFADANCSVKFGTNPAATATTMPLAANVPEYFQVPAGQSYKVAVISRA